MARFKNGYDLPTPIIAGFLAQKRSIDRDDVLRLAVYLAMREAGVSHDLALTISQPRLDLMDEVELPLDIAPEQAWRWRTLGRKAMSEALVGFLQGAQQAQAYSEVYRTRGLRWATKATIVGVVNHIKTRLEREGRIAEEAVRKVLSTA